MPTPGSPTVRQRRLAAELRRLRDVANRTGDQVAAALGWSPSKVSRYELARTGLNPADVRKLLDYYGTAGSHREQLLALAQEATQKGWWEAYAEVLPDELLALIALEDEARSALQWQLEVIPGLLQTEAYARQVISSYQNLAPLPPGRVERRVEARLRRQQVLLRDQPLDLSVVLDESALLRTVAGPPVMRAQLQHLIEVAQLPNVTVQVFPLQALYPVITASFVLLHFGQVHETTLHDVVSTEPLQSDLYVEGETDIYQYRLAFDRLASGALDAGQSLKLISRITERAWT